MDNDCWYQAPTATFRDILPTTITTCPQSKEAKINMLNTASLHAVNNSTFSQHFVKPLYDSYCFSNIPQTIPFLLTGEGQSALPLAVFGDLPTRYDKVILFFVDAFGWRFFERSME